MSVTGGLLVGDLVAIRLNRPLKIESACRELDSIGVALIEDGAHWFRRSPKATNYFVLLLVFVKVRRERLEYLHYDR